MAFLRLSSGARGHSCGVLPVVQNLILLSLLLTTVYAQDTVLIPTTASDSFPACGLSCSALQQAQSSCVYPQAPKTDRATYVSCFCQSALLTNLHSGSNGPCDTECTSSSDRSLLSTWYNNFCNAKGNLPATTASSTTTSSTSASTANTGASANNSQDDEAQPWIKTHYRWVIMIVVLFVGFSIITVVAVWLKRRHEARHPGLYQSANVGGSSGTLFTKTPRDSAVPVAAPGLWASPPGVGHLPNSHYTDPEPLPNSSHTAVSMPRST